LGGIPDLETKQMKWGIAIPGALSFLAFNDIDAEVKGLDQIPEADWPPLTIVHIAFQIMVAIGSLLALVGGIALYFEYRKIQPPWFLKTILYLSPLGFLAIEAGWVVTEVGRQPWIIYGFLRTKDAVTPVPGMQFHFFLFLALYLGLGGVTAWLFKRQIAVADRNLRIVQGEKRS
jgi:cytochrome bd ubiquinol oxidase subunit I